MTSTPTPEETEVLAECYARQRVIAAVPRPPAWQRWALAEYEELVRCGPRYLPGQWFGGGQPVPERFRVRYLRAVGRLQARGLVVVTTTGGRLSHLRLTPEGERVAAAALDAAPALPVDRQAPTTPTE